MSLRLFFFFLFVVCWCLGVQQGPAQEVAFICASPALKHADTLRCDGHGRAVRGAYGWLLGPKIPLNHARWSDLVMIRGIGPHLARAIINRRDKLGRFRNWPEIDAIRGMGAQKLKQIQSVCHL
jgi:competence protein ComEA